MEKVTYSLKIEHNSTQNYYHTIRKFTDTVLKKSANSLIPIVNEFKEYIKAFELEEVRETEEYILELISFGILWKSYAQTALLVHYAPFITLARMAEWRKKHQNLKPYIDLARGILTTLCLLPRNLVNKEMDTPTLEQIDHVCKWFEATGEFREEALRFVRWRAFWGTKQPEDLKKIFSTIREFRIWFESSSKDELGIYTENVNKF